MIKQYILELIEIIISKTQDFDSTQAIIIVSALGPIEKLLAKRETRAFIEKIVILLATKNSMF